MVERVVLLLVALVKQVWVWRAAALLPRTLNSVIDSGASFLFRYFLMPFHITLSRIDMFTNASALRS